jgi:hypothetical protein
MVVLTSCSKDLNVEYKNKPDKDLIFSGPGNVYNIDENTDGIDIPLSTYQQGIEALLKSLDKCIKICNENNFKIPNDWINNSGSRVERGHLSPLSSNTNINKLLKAIFYERDTELFQSGFGIVLFDMRRRDMLQPGTLLQFPIPAKELMVMNTPLHLWRC